MQSGDSIKTAVPIGTPLQIQGGGQSSMILPKVKIEELAANESVLTTEQQPFQRKKTTHHPVGIVLTPDSVNYLIIPPKHELYSFPKLEFIAKDSNSYNILESSPSPTDYSSFKIADQEFEKNDVVDESYTSKEIDGFSGIKPNLKIHQDSSFILVLVCFALIVYAIKAEGDKITRKIKNIFSRNTVSREQTTMPLVAGLCLTVQTILIFALLLSNILSLEFAPFQPSNPVLTTFVIAGVIGVFIIIKMQASRLLEIIFPDKKLLQSMRRQQFTAIQLLGIFSFLPALLYIYSEGMDVILILMIILFFILERIISIYHVAFNFSQEKINFLFLIVYLCTIEILPYFILYEIVTLIYKLDLTSILWH